MTTADNIRIKHPAALIFTFLPLLFIIFLSQELSAQNPSTEIHKVAAILPLTGKAEFEAGNIRKAIELSYSDYCRDLVPKFSIEYFNSYSNPDSARIVAEKLCIDSAYIAVVGGYNAQTTAVIANVTEKHKTPFIIFGSSEDYITKSPNSYRFRISPPFSDFNDGLLAWAISNIGKDRPVSIIFENSPGYHIEVFDLLSDLRARWSGSVTSHSYSQYKTDFVEAVELLRKNEPTAVFILGSNKFTVEFLRDCKQIGWCPAAFLFASVKMANNRIVSLSQGDAEFIFAPQIWTSELHYPGIETLKEKRQDGGRIILNHKTAEAYAVVEVLAGAFERCFDRDRNTLRLAIGATDLMTVFGRIRFENYSQYYQQNRLRSQALQLQKNKWRIVYPLKFSKEKYIYPIPDWRERTRPDYNKFKVGKKQYLSIVFLGMLAIFFFYSWRYLRRREDKEK